MMKPKYTRESITARLQAHAKRVERILVDELLYMAEEGVNQARQMHTYTDQTGNLTSSIGYELYINGVSYSKNFQPFEGGYDSGEYGVAKGEELSASIGADGYFSLIFVAGMPYAEEVELKGKEVLNPAYLYVEEELPKLIQRVLRLINKR